MDYAEYKRALRADFACFQRAKIYYEALYDRMELTGKAGVPRAHDHATFTRGISEGETAENMLVAAKLALRIQTSALAQACKKSILRRLGVVEKQYFKKVKKHRNLPMVSYDAATPQSVRELRNGLIASLSIADHRDPELAHIPNEAWIRSLRNYRNALDMLKDQARLLSTQIVGWNKTIEDKWRLNIAIAAVIATFAIFLYREIKDSMLPADENEVTDRVIVTIY